MRRGRINATEFASVPNRRLAALPVLGENTVVRRQLQMHRRRLGLEPLESRLLLADGPLITELMAANQGGLRDDDRDSSDWIELHNPTAQAVDLEGWYLTDRADELTRWQLPAVGLAPGQYLVVFASGKDRTDPKAALHANFKLDADGEFLAMVRPDGISIGCQFAPGFPAQRADISYGLADDLATRLFFATPTPGARNVDGALGVVSTPTVSVSRGLFDQPFDVMLASAAPDSQLRYTLDGSRPSATTGTAYEGPIPIEGTTTLRVAAFRPGHIESDVVTHTYLFPQDVLEQPSQPEGFPSQWVLEDGEVWPAVYDVLPQVVRFHQDTILDDLLPSRHCHW